jgi:hypothetical protein
MNAQTLLKVLLWIIVLASFGFTKTREICFPDSNWVEIHGDRMRSLYLEGRDSHVLLLNKPGSKIADTVIAFQRGLCVDPSPYKDWVLMTVHEQSNEANSYLFSLEKPSQKTDLKMEFEKAHPDPNSKDILSCSHLYIEGEGWKDKEKVRLRVKAYNCDSEKSYDKIYQYQLKRGFIPTTQK